MKKMVLLAFMLPICIVTKAQNKNYIDQPYIEVNGYADTLVTPNEIFIRIHISEKDTKDRLSVEDLEQKMVTSLKELGLDPEKDLSTSDMASIFKFYLLKSKDVIKTKLYTLKVTDAVIASKVFTKLEEIGISNTSIDRVDHSDADDLRNRMRTKAILNAKERATSLTRPLNQTVGAAIHIDDTENVSQQLQGSLAGVQIRGISTNQNDYNKLPAIEFKQIKVVSNINAKFILK